jgi:hypothetical protein
MCQSVRAHIEGRNAVRFERERRATLLTVPYALPPGTHLYEQRPDRSILRLQRPPEATAVIVVEEHPPGRAHTGRPE